MTVAKGEILEPHLLGAFAGIQPRKSFGSAA